MHAYACCINMLLKVACYYELVDLFMSHPIHVEYCNAKVVPNFTFTLFAVACAPVRSHFASIRSDSYLMYAQDGDGDVIKSDCDWSLHIIIDYGVCA